MINGRSLEAEVVVVESKAGFVPYTEVQTDVCQQLLEKFPLHRSPLTSEAIPYVVI